MLNTYQFIYFEIFLYYKLLTIHKMKNHQIQIYVLYPSDYLKTSQHIAAATEKLIEQTFFVFFTSSFPPSLSLYSLSFSLPHSPLYFLPSIQRCCSAKQPEVGLGKGFMIRCFFFLFFFLFLLFLFSFPLSHSERFLL